MRWSQASIISPQTLAQKQAETRAVPPAVRLVLPGEAPVKVEQTTAERLGLEPTQPAESLPAGFGAPTVPQAGVQQASAGSVGVYPFPSASAAPSLPASPTLDAIRAWLSQRDAMMLAVEDERMKLRARLAELDQLALELEAIGAKS